MIIVINALGLGINVLDIRVIVYIRFIWNLKLKNYN